MPKKSDNLRISIDLRDYLNDFKSELREDLRNDIKDAVSVHMMTCSTFLDYWGNPKTNPPTLGLRTRLIGHLSASEGFNKRMWAVLITVAGSMGAIVDFIINRLGLK